GGCATTQATNPLVFAMQVFASFISHVLFPTLLTALSDDSPGCALLSHRHSVNGYYLPSVSESSRLAAPPLEHWILDQAWKAQSTPTRLDAAPIKQRRPPAALCGLGGCARTQATNPLVFAMQVGKPYGLFAKKSSNYFLVQLPSPQCCLAICAECVHVVRFLLLLSGDVETNPGPDNAVLVELQKLSTGQSQLLAEVQGLKFQLQTTDKTMSELSKRMAELEGHYQSLATVRTELETTRADTAQTARQVCDLEACVDDAENRSRRNNMIFYGLPDPTASETFAQSEQRVIRLCFDLFNVTLDPKEIERTHRLGRYTANQCRPIIVKFAFFKTKEFILSNGPKLKGTNYSIGEDFSRPVRNARRHLVAFAKTKSAAFSLRYKTLFIGSKRYIFYEATKTVKEIA
ncbi:uncharacterized protein LOC121834265, partial [Ixodes scapularis]|uniref:uncharacterized protein LOC121834265 n=1 Tax=Ixodes scapularis TaxID=6945 RepID=UPI001C389CAF